VYQNKQKPNHFSGGGVRSLPPIAREKNVTITRGKKRKKGSNYQKNTGNSTLCRIKIMMTESVKKRMISKSFLMVKRNFFRGFSVVFMA
jgi:hypothetical protein